MVDATYVPSPSAGVTDRVGRLRQRTPNAASLADQGIVHVDMPRATATVRSRRRVGRGDQVRYRQTPVKMDWFSARCCLSRRTDGLGDATDFALD